MFRIIRIIMALVSLIIPLKNPTPKAPENPVTAQTSNPFMSTYGNTQISAHRLGKGNAPENTLAAVRACLDDAQNNPFDFFEMDLQITKDGELVVYHSLYLDEVSDSAEHFGKKNTTVFSKTYAQLRELNMGESFRYNGETPYKGLRGEDIPDEIRISKLTEIVDYIESEVPGEYRYTMEIKYPHPWAPKMVDKLYTILKERDMLDRVIVASFWPDVNDYITRKYDGKIIRAGGVFEAMALYTHYKLGDKIDTSKLKYSVLQLPFYYDDMPLSDLFGNDPKRIKLIGNIGSADFIAYCHKYNIAVQYWTINGQTDMLELRLAGADAVMTDHPDRVNSVYGRFSIDEPLKPAE